MEKILSQKENGAVIMDDELRRRLLTEWQNKKKETITHPFLKEKVGMGNSALCAGNASGKISERRY